MTITLYTRQGTAQQVSEGTTEKLAKLDAAQAKREATRTAATQAARFAEEIEKAARREQFLSENTADIEMLTPLADAPLFADILARLTDDLRPLSEAQRAMVNREIVKRAQNAASAYVGEVGQKIELTLTCDRIVSFAGYYGTQWLHICHDENGNAVTYKGSASFLTEGESAPVKAKIAEHTEYNGRKQTRIERPKVAA